MAKKIKNRVETLIADVQRVTGKRYTIQSLAEEIGISETSVKNWKYNNTTRFDAPQMLAFLEFFNKHLKTPVTMDDLLVVMDDGNEDEASGQRKTLLTALAS